MSVYEEFNAVIIDISGEYDPRLAATQSQCNSTTKWPNPLLQYPLWNN